MNFLMMTGKQRVMKKLIPILMFCLLLCGCSAVKTGQGEQSQQAVGNNDVVVLPTAPTTTVHPIAETKTTQKQGCETTKESTVVLPTKSSEIVSQTKTTALASNTQKTGGGVAMSTTTTTTTITTTTGSGFVTTSSQDGSGILPDFGIELPDDDW